MSLQALERQRSSVMFLHMENCQIWHLVGQKIQNQFWDKTDKAQQYVYLKEVYVKCV